MHKKEKTKKQIGQEERLGDLLLKGHTHMAASMLGIWYPILLNLQDKGQVMLEHSLGEKKPLNFRERK